MNFQLGNYVQSFIFSGPNRAVKTQFVILVSPKKEIKVETTSDDKKKSLNPFLERDKAKSDYAKRDEAKRDDAKRDQAKRRLFK